MKLMGFAITEDAAEADAVVGGYGLDEESLAAVQAGVPLVGYSADATETVPGIPSSGMLKPAKVMWSAARGYLTIPEETLVNASYILDEDDIFFGGGGSYFTALPEGAKVLVQRDGSRAPLSGVFHGDEESINAYLNGIMGFSYTGKDASGSDVNITLFANSMTEGAHQRDEYAFISNALFSDFLTETPYVTAAE